MGDISVLSREISELIAAGEVIERPASVIKELLENSIDSGAKHITVEIKNGGTTYMRITDDGCGIASKQVPIAFLRHATSKILLKEDLDNILTLGFRGEALASISAVSRVELLSKRKADNIGTNYIIEGGIEKLYEESGCPNGTTIIIRDLFYNVPVRQKFMKRDSTEAGAILNIMQKIVLSNPAISFKFIKDNKIEFNSSGDGELYSAIYSVYGSGFAHDLIPAEYEQNGISVKGFVIKPLYAKSNRSFQSFFINGRYVKSVTFMAAVEEAYKNLIMTGKFPACVLMVTAPPAAVDVNVHPAKAEVRFSDEKIIFNSVYFAVKNALMSSGLIYEFQMKDVPADSTRHYKPDFEPEVVQQPKLSNVNVSSSSECRNEYIQPVSNSDDIAELSSNKAEYMGKDHNLSVPMTKREEDKVFTVNKPEKFTYISSDSFTERVSSPNSENTESPEIAVIGEAFKNYIIAQCADLIIIIDKHAAHERVIFERLKNENKNSESQLVISPTEILLSQNEFSALQENQDVLENMGFKLDFSNQPYVCTAAVPIMLEHLNMDEIIPEIAENFYLCKANPQTHLVDDILHNLACKAAIKANDNNNISELQKLAETVFNDENIRHCPHGRPVMFTLSKRDIEKQFKRI